MQDFEVVSVQEIIHNAKVRFNFEFLNIVPLLSEHISDPVANQDIFLTFMRARTNSLEDYLTELNGTSSDPEKYGVTDGEIYEFYYQELKKDAWIKSLICASEIVNADDFEWSDVSIPECLLRFMYLLFKAMEAVGDAAVDPAIVKSYLRTYMQAKLTYDFKATNELAEMDRYITSKEWA